MEQLPDLAPISESCSFASEREATVPVRKCIDPNKTTKAPQGTTTTVSPKTRRRKKASEA
jgi:hypothetical protein